MIRKLLLIFAATLCGAPAARAADEQSKEFAIVGLFSPDREQDLRDVMADVPEFQLFKVDYENARVTFRYDPQRLFADQKPKKSPTDAEIEQRVNALLTRASANTFSVKVTPPTPGEKLTKVQISVGILDCKGCRYAAYLAVVKVAGVERATVAKDGAVTAMVDADKTNPAALEDALKRANIEHRAKP
jgi:hypothetical protein